MEKVRRYAQLYFAVQGVAVIAWWFVLWIRPGTRELFRIEAEFETSLLAFFFPDVVFIAFGSIATSILISIRNRYDVAVVWLVTGAVSYATFYTLATSLMTNHGWLGVTLMLPAMLWSGTFATGITVGSEMFREAHDTRTRYVMLKTFVQIVVVWSIILLVFPYLLTILEDKLGITRIEFAYQRPVAAVLFLAVSGVGIWAAQSMSRLGKGTPLPLDHARYLVVRGPYAFVRNPMAVSGILQGLAVALFLGSPLVVIYALMGSAIWQLIFRPLEEDDLASRFGESFDRYRQSVRCWIPNREAYQIDGTTDSSISTESPLGRM